MGKVCEIFDEDQERDFRNPQALREIWKKSLWENFVLLEDKLSHEKERRIQLGFRYVRGKNKNGKHE